MAMAKRERSLEHDNYYSSDEENGLKLYLAGPQPLTRPVRSLGPTAGQRESGCLHEKRTPRPVQSLPRIVVPQDAAGQHDPPTPPPKSPFMQLVHAKRKTIMEKIEGWWDLDLIEKRQTLLKAGVPSLRRKPC